MRPIVPTLLTGARGVGGIIAWLALAALLPAAATAEVAPQIAPPATSPSIGSQAVREALLAKDLPAGIMYVRSVEGVHEYGLTNGLQVLLVPDSSAPKVTVNIVYRVGSRHEVYGETGMAHLLEHLLFKGTPRHTDIPQEFKQRGARFNGTTDFDRTNYFETVPASEDNLAWAIELEADRMVNSFISRKHLDTEMTVVRNEFEIGESRPDRVLWQHVDAAMFRWHNYGKAVIGSRSDIENVAIARLQAFYQAYYRPDNATLIVAGKFTPAAALSLIGEHFGPIARPAHAIEPQYTVEPTQAGERLVTVRRTGESPLIQVAYRNVAGQHPDVAPLRILASLLGAAPNGRLHKRLVETGKATSVAEYFFAGFDPGKVSFAAVLRKQDSPEAARDEMIAIIEGLAGEPVTQAEVDRAKAAFAARFQELQANTQALATGALTSAVADGDWRLLYWMRDEIAKVTPADVQRAAQHYFKRDNRTVGMFLPTDKPDRAEIPPRLDPAVVLKDYTGGDAMSMGEDFDPSQANIDKRTTIVKLAGGLKLALLDKQTRGDRVHGQLQLHLGSPDSLMGWGAAPSVLGALLNRGTRRLSRGALSDEITRLKAQLSITGAANSVVVRFSTTRENLDTLVRLMAECLREPALSADEFDQVKRSRQREIESALKNPQSLANQRLSALFNAYGADHPFYTGSLAEQRERIDKVTLDEVKRFHAEFYGASSGEFSLVGGFEPKRVEQLVEETLGTWRSPKPYARIPKAQADAAGASVVIDVPDQANAVLAARLNVKLRDADPDYPSFVVANTIFGGGSMSSRLGTRLRQKEGMSYGSGSALTVPVISNTGSFTVFASYAPKSAGRLQAAVCEEIASALSDGFTAGELALAKDSILGGGRVNRSSDESLVGILNTNLQYGRAMRWSAEFEDKVKAATLDDVNAVFRRHIDPARLVMIKAGSFGAAAGKPDGPACEKSK